MSLCCPISAASGSHFLLATNLSAFILTVFRRCEGNRQYRIILSADTASEVRQPPERCLSRKAGIMRCCQYFLKLQAIYYCLNRQIIPAWFPKRFSVQKYKLYYLTSLIQNSAIFPPFHITFPRFYLSSSMPTFALALSLSTFAFLPIPPNPIVWSAVLIPNRIIRLIYAILFLVFSFYSA